MKPSKESGLPRNLGEYISKSVNSANFARLLQFYGSHANNLLFLAKVLLPPPPHIFPSFTQLTLATLDSPRQRPPPLLQLSLLVQDLISGNTGKNLVEALINGGGLK
jgi:hypothetical protein